MNLNSINFQVKILIASFVATVLFSIIIVPILRKLKVGQIERDDGPTSHLTKMGTPTMGGVIILLRNYCSICGRVSLL